jgi:uncharacterized protein (DUF3084 family)
MTQSTLKARAELIELKNIHAETTRLKETLKGLNAKSKTLQASIMQYLKDTNQHSISYGEFKVEVSTRQKRERKTKGIKEKDALDVLQKAGIRDAKRLYRDMMSSIQGDVSETTVLRVDKK